ncbi:MAG: hypothetical protein MUO89_04540 [Dehalococcoidia bacterium]|nr:hypothetical protein [Dehalococcoidia bacterium]
MGSNDALSDRQMLEKINDQLEQQGKTLGLRFYLSIATTYIVMFLSIGLASLSLGKTKELSWIILIPLLCALLTIYWTWLKYRQTYHKKFAISGSILLFIGVPTLDKLLNSFPINSMCPIQIAICYLAALLTLSGIILIFVGLAPSLAKKK